MKKKHMLFGLGTAVVACSVAGALLIPGSDNANNVDDKKTAQVETTDLSGETNVLSAGVTYYLNQLSTDNVDLSAVTGDVILAQGGISNIISSYGDMISAGIEANIEDLDVATQFVPEGSIIKGYSNLGISNVSDYLNVRKGPSTNDQIVGKMPGNCACEVLSENNGWYEIQSGNVYGYVYGEYILTGYEANVKAMESMGTALYVNCDVLNVRSEASTDCDVSTSVAMGEYLEILDTMDGWYKVDINNLQGYVCADYVEEVHTLPTAVEIVEVVANTQYNNANNGNGANNGSSANGTNGNGGNGGNSYNAPSYNYQNLDSTVSQTAVDLIQNGMQYLGCPYVSGGNSLSNGTDCSGYVKLLYEQYGYSLPRSSADYLNTGYTYIPASEAKPGDIFLYNYGGVIGHVGVYIGNGQLMHASTPSQGIKIGSAFYTQPYCALRVIP